MGTEYTDSHEGVEGKKHIWCIKSFMFTPLGMRSFLFNLYFLENVVGITNYDILSCTERFNLIWYSLFFQNNFKK